LTSPKANRQIPLNGPVPSRFFVPSLCPEKSSGLCCTFSPPLAPRAFSLSAASLIHKITVFFSFFLSLSLSHLPLFARHQLSSSGSGLESSFPLFPRSACLTPGIFSQCRQSSGHFPLFPSSFALPLPGLHFPQAHACSGPKFWFCVRHPHALNFDLLSIKGHLSPFFRIPFWFSLRQIFSEIF